MASIEIHQRTYKIYRIKSEVYGGNNMVKNKYGEVNVERRIVASVNVFAEIEVVDYMDDTVSMWLSKEDVENLIDELSKLLQEQ